MYRKEPRSQINRQIVAELRKGESITKLCEKYGVTQGNVSQLRQRYVNRPTGLPHERKKYLALQDIKYSGLSIKEIAKKYKMGETTVNLLKKLYIDTEYWEQIPLPVRSKEKDVSETRVQSTQGEVVIEKTWEKNRSCSGCGRMGSVRINIQNGRRGIGISFCKCCLIYIKNEVIEGIDDFVGEAETSNDYAEVPMEELEGREVDEGTMTML